MPKFCVEIADIRYRHVIIDAPSEEACNEWWDNHSVEDDAEFLMRFPNEGRNVIDHVETFDVDGSIDHKIPVNIKINEKGEQL